MPKAVKLAAKATPVLKTTMADVERDLDGDLFARADKDTMYVASLEKKKAQPTMSLVKADTSTKQERLERYFANNGMDNIAKLLGLKGAKTKADVKETASKYEDTDEKKRWAA